MIPEDRKLFVRLIRAAYEVNSKSINDDGIKLWWNSLCKYDIDDVKEGLQRFITEADTYTKLIPGEVIKRLPVRTNIVHAVAESHRICDEATKKAAEEARDNIRSLITNMSYKSKFSEKKVLT